MTNSGAVLDDAIFGAETRDTGLRADAAKSMEAAAMEAAATERAGFAAQPAFVRADYGNFVKPRVAELLHAVGLDVTYHRAEGDWLWYLDESGVERRVLDLLGGFGSSLFGHNAPVLVECLRGQLAARRPFNAQASVRGMAGTLGRRLSEMVERSTGERYVATFSNSGAEAVEAALKHAEMEAWQKHTRIIQEMRLVASHARNALDSGENPFAPDALPAGVTTRRDIDAWLHALIAYAEAELSRPAAVLALCGAFHGKTSGALRLTHNAAYRAPWARWGHAHFVPPDDLAALDRAIAENTLAVTRLTMDEAGKVRLVPSRFVNVSGLFCEPIQGEGGVRELDAAFFAKLRALADEHEFPLIIDEIQSGMGRTGRFLASEWPGVRGDYYLLSKSLGGGLTKIAALLVDRRRYVHDFGYLHTSTFAEDDHSCAVALAALDCVERSDRALLGACRNKGQHLLSALSQLQKEYPEQISEVRGRGLMVGVALRCQRRSPSTLLRVLSEQSLLGFFVAGYLLREHGIRVAPALSEQSTIRIEPSAEIALSEIDRFVTALRRAAELLRDADVVQLCGVEVTGEVTRASITGGSAPAVAAVPAARRRVGFLAHLRDARDLRLIEPRLRGLSDEGCGEVMSRVQQVLEPFVLGEETIRSALGSAVELSVIAVPFTAAQAVGALRGDRGEWVLAQVRSAVALAAERGASIVGCGGYTSIISNNCQSLITEGFGVTSGNSLTAAAAVDALVSAANRRNVGRRVLGVVGAAGNIGAMLSELAAEHAESVVLVGRPGAVSRLERVAARMKCPTSISTDLGALRECSLIVSATNSPVPIILPEHIGAGPVIVCDAAVPHDVSPRVAVERPNAIVLRGGAVRLPLDQTLQIEGVSISAGAVYACLAETALLGLSGTHGSFSCGALQSEKVRLIRTLAYHHGFVIEENVGIGPESWRGLDG